MAEIIYLDEHLLKQDIKKVEDAIKEARTLSTQGHDIPAEVFEDLEALRDILDYKLKLLVTGSGSM